MDFRGLGKRFSNLGRAFPNLAHLQLVSVQTPVQPLRNVPCSSSRCGKPIDAIQVDNLCRNPPLVVLVPASQEAEPLDITVTLHPRAAQMQAQGHKQSPSRHYRHTIDGGAKGPQANSPPSPGELPEPPSPSSLGSGSAAASPSFGHRSSDVQRSPPSARNSERDFTSPGGGGDGDVKAQHQLAGKGWGRNGVQTGGGVKRRGRLKIPGGGRVTLTRTGSAAGGRVAPTTLPVPPDMRQAASWDGGTQSLAATAPAGLGRPWAEDEGEAVASPTGQRKPEQRLVSSRTYGADGRESSSATGGGIFASLARRRSVDLAAGYSGSKVGLNSKRSVASAMSAMGKGDSGKGHQEGVVRGGLSSAPAAALASYKMFFGDTDDGGEESESSNDEEDGPLFRRSYIQVTCTARTSYKLFSSDPQVGDGIGEQFNYRPVLYIVVKKLRTSTDHSENFSGRCCGVRILCLACDIHEPSACYTCSVSQP